MRFGFNGSIDELTETIFIKAKEYKKDIIIKNDSPEILKIGFCRYGHSNGGRFFVANISESDGKIILHGEIKEISNNHSKASQNKIVRFFVDEIWLSIVAYLILAFVPVMLWMCVFYLNHIWVPLILPIPILGFFRYIEKKKEKKTNDDFIKFMSTFCEYINE